MNNTSKDDNDELEIIDLDYDPEEKNPAQKEEEQASESLPALDEEVAAPLEEDSEISTHIKELEESLVEKEKEIEKLKDRLLRQQADYENFNKRMQKEIKQIQELASESIIKDLLPVFDNIERGLEIGTDLGEDHPHIEGLRLIRELFWKVLTDQGVERIQALNEKFDPRFHMAANIAKTDEYPEDTVIDEYQPGFMLKSKVIRPSMVVVSKKLEQEKKSARSEDSEEKKTTDESEQK
ncbi:MAG: nucleotide exchange factor GrpE [Candidatus Thorarchaeota archaeon]